MRVFAAPQGIKNHTFHCFFIYNKCNGNSLTYFRLFKTLRRVFVHLIQVNGAYIGGIDYVPILVPNDQI